MVWHVGGTTVLGTAAFPRRLAALSPTTAPVWWTTRPDAQASILHHSQACAGLIRRSSFVTGTRLARALSPWARGTPATRSAVGAGSRLCNISVVCSVTSSAMAPPTA
jgi:hypothetical protein